MGLVPISPVMLEVGTLVIPDLDRIVKFKALLRFTMGVTGGGADGPQLAKNPIFELQKGHSIS